MRGLNFADPRTAAAVDRRIAPLTSKAYTLNQEDIVIYTINLIIGSFYVLIKVIFSQSLSSPYPILSISISQTQNP
jgi:hypothetical protein